MKFGLEARIGFFIILSIILLSFLGLAFGKFSFEKETYYTVTFKIDNAEGLKAGTIVFYRGITVGKLVSITFEDEQLLAKLEISDKYNIPNNVIFAIRQMSVVGDKSIELIQSDDIVADGYLSADDVYVDRQGGTSIATIMDSIDIMALKIAELADSINTIITKDTTQEAVIETLESLKSVAKSLDTIVIENDQSFTSLVLSLGNTMKAIERIVVRNEHIVDKTITDIDEIIVTMNTLTKSINSFISDNETGIGSEIQPITQNINATIKNINQITADINSGKGTIGLLISDNETKEDVKSIIKGAKKIIGSLGGGINFSLSAGAEYVFNLNNIRGHAQLRIYPEPNSFILLGVSNKPVYSPRLETVNFEYIDSNGIVRQGSYESKSNNDASLGLSLQYSYVFFRWLGLRAGLFENTVGAAIDIYPLRSHTLTVSFESYDYRVNNNNNNNQFEVFLKTVINYSFLNYFYIQAGVEDILNFNQRGFSVGAGVRLLNDNIKYFTSDINGV